MLRTSAGYDSKGAAGPAEVEARVSWTRGVRESRTGGAEGVMWHGACTVLSWAKLEMICGLIVG